MLHRGKFVIGLMIAVAIALSAYAWWYQYHRNPRIKGLLGTAGVLAIQYSPHVEFIRLSSDSAADSQSSKIGDLEYRGIPIDISRSSGLVHVRHALLNDGTYDWEKPPEDAAPWDFVLRFSGDQHPPVTIAFTGDCDSMMWIEGQQSLRLTPASAAAFRKKRNDWEGDQTTSHSRSAMQPSAG